MTLVLIYYSIVFASLCLGLFTLYEKAVISSTSFWSQLQNEGGEIFAVAHLVPVLIYIALLRGSWHVATSVTRPFVR